MIFKSLNYSLVAASIVASTHAYAGTDKSDAKAYGKMHGQAIKCNLPEAHDFGVAAMKYLRRNAPGNFESLREAYGLTMIENAKSIPRGGCSAHRQKLKQTLSKFKS